MTDESLRFARLYNRASKVAANASSALALSAIFAVIVCRLVIWFPPAMLQLWTIWDFLLALASTFQDYCVLMLLIGFHWCGHSVITQKQKHRRIIIDIVFAILYLIFIAIITSNVISLHSLGAVFDLNWFSDVNLSNISTVNSIVINLMTQRKIIFLVGCLVLLPTLSMLIHCSIRKEFKVYVVLVSATTLAAGGLNAALSSPIDSISRASKTYSPIAGGINSAIFPSTIQLLLGGEAGVDPEAERLIGVKDWLASPSPAVSACCKGMNIVLITLDSVPLKSVSREFVLKHPDQYPNLAKLYQRSIAYDNFYTNYPSSTEALGVMIGSIYASNAPFQNSVNEWIGREVPTLPGVLAANDYTMAHFMSGDLAYDSVKDFLKDRGFSKIEDSHSLTCSENDKVLRGVYTHIGDDCIAGAAAHWIQAAPRAPFFVWAWFTNPHTPYFTNRSPFDGTQGRSARRHAESVRDTDAAIGKVLKSLEARNLMDETIIIVTADHGEAFGEHGYFYHGTSLHDEQVRIPLLISAPTLPKEVMTNTLGSTIDLAPTITGLVGIPAPAEWQGRSLFSRDRMKRAYFTALSGGRIAGYREGKMKYILSSLEDQPFAYNLAKDPGEQHPISLPFIERRIVAARLGAFVRHRNAMRFTKLQVQHLP